MTLMLPFSLRSLESEDLSFLKEMFYQSLFVPPQSSPFPKEIIDRPDLAKYHLNWGKKKGDIGLLAYKKEELIGAVWCRKFSEADRGYGFIDPDTPELGIALREIYRGQGIGTQLLEAMTTTLCEQGILQVSLSADARNPAYRLYLRHGFKLVEKEGFSCKMLKPLLPKRK